MNAVLQLRPVRPEDETFLRDLRAAIDVERLGIGHWVPDAGSEKLANSLVNLQFAAHAAHYRRVKNRWDTKDCVIELNGHPVGRFILRQDAGEIYLSDLAVHPNFRGQGLGQAVIESTKHECQQSKRLLHLHVNKLNTALEFYLQLGFRIIGDSDTQHFMEWVPPSLLDRVRVFAPPPK